MSEQRNSPGGRPPSDVYDPGPRRALPTDVAEVGLSSTLFASLPLLAMLTQCVAESEGEWNFLRLEAASGAWVGLGCRGDQDALIVSTNAGGGTPDPDPSPAHEALVGHGFEFDAVHKSYHRLISFETDDAFMEIARLIVGTFQHAYGTSLQETLSVKLHLDGVPYPPVDAPAQAGSKDANEVIGGAAT